LRARPRLADWQWALLGVLVILGAWEVYGRFSNPFFVPPVTRVFGELREFIASGVLLKALQHTFFLLVVGMTLGSLVGVPLGLLLGVFRSVGDVLAPYIQGAYATPRIALIPVVIIFFGTGLQGQLLLVFLQCVFEIMIATEAGAREVQGQFIEVAKSFRLSKFQTFFKVIAPGSFPYIVSGLRLGLSNAFIGAIGAELFLESAGMGGLIYITSQSFRTDRALALIIVMTVTAIALISLMRYMERKSQSWRIETFE
jgi:ABC-type nitrate/sulfonate/bicarbonate transport system permease component